MKPIKTQLLNKPVRLVVPVLISACILLSSNSFAAPLEEVVVTAELIETNVLKLPNSVTVIDSLAIEQRAARQLEDLLNLAPNVNYASGASRGRFPCML